LVVIIIIIVIFHSFISIYRIFICPCPTRQLIFSISSRSAAYLRGLLLLLLLLLPVGKRRCAWKEVWIGTGMMEIPKVYWKWMDSNLYINYINFMKVGN